MVSIKNQFRLQFSYKNKINKFNNEQKEIKPKTETIPKGHLYALGVTWADKYGFIFRL